MPLGELDLADLVPRLIGKQSGEFKDVNSGPMNHVQVLELVDRHDSC